MLLFIFGTRPESIKLAPLIKKFQEDKKFNVKVCVTAQHREMLDQFIEFFQIKPDYDLNIMKSNQSLFDITTDGLKNLEKVIKTCKPDIIFIQGDATSAFVGALAGFYNKIKVAHIEAGLRSHNKYSPFPEEINRTLISHLSDYHFAPTQRAKQNLINQGIKENIYVVGNTVVDALLLILKVIKNNPVIEKQIENYFNETMPSFHSLIANHSRIILVTIHRREIFGRPLKDICLALKEIAKREDVKIIYPVHLNPNVKEVAFGILNNVENIYLTQPIDYLHFIWLIDKCYLILTDSGGIQEEAPSFGKPVLVLRNVTERVEGIEVGVARLIGTNKEKIIDEVVRLVNSKEEYNKMAKPVNPYGDGKSSERIKDIIGRLSL